MAKIGYFTAGTVATTDEKTAIAALEASIAPANTIGVRGPTDHNYGSGKEAFDYVYGTVPTAYNAVPVYDPTKPPAAAVGSKQKVVTDAVAITGVTLVGTAGAGKSMVCTIVAGVITTATFT